MRRWRTYLLVAAACALWLWQYGPGVEAGLQWDGCRMPYVAAWWKGRRGLANVAVSLQGRDLCWQYVPTDGAGRYGQVEVVPVK